MRAQSGNVPAKPGFYLNTAVGNLSLSTTADTFRVTVDGISSSAITLGTSLNPDPTVVAASFVRGIADQLDQLMDTCLDPGGLLSNRTSALNQALEGISEERVELEERLKNSEAPWY